MSVSVRAGRRRVVNAFVQVGGVGTKATGTTRRRGTVKLSIRPKGAGVRVTVPNVTRCAKRARIPVGR